MFIEKFSKKLSKDNTFVNYVLVTITCKDGFSVSLCSIGASIYEIKYKISENIFKNIALSYADFSAYLGNPLYAGATLAPNAGRICDGQLPIDDTLFQLSKNENHQHNLHGGFHNASFVNWELLEVRSSSDSVCVTFSLCLPDQLDGFPGNRTLKATYTLTEEHVLTIDYEAVSDQSTYFNLSNHSYFNLSGDFSQNADFHMLTVQADQVILNRPDFIPESIAAVAGTPFDFRRSISLQSQYHSYPEHIQLTQNRGYNHGFILSHASNVPDCICIDPVSSYGVCISSDAPCMVLYSGGFIEADLALADQQYSCPSCAIAFEFQDYPDAPGMHHFPYHTTPAGQRWTRHIHYQFFNQIK